MLAYDFPLLGAFLTMLWFFIWVMWLFLLFRTVADIFRSEDLSGVAKVAWLIFVIVLPYLGVFVYIIARGTGMTRRDIERHRAAEEAFRGYIRETASSGPADELQKLADLRERGVISEAEFEQQKARVLS
jgi:hypothetical protein